ncbi:YbhB/YbcL family Raf kinase inhibitor-like protein [Chloroflexota bacterium]
MNGKRLYILTAICLIGIIFTSCGQSEYAHYLEEREIALSSPAFEDGAIIPEKYSCEGEDISPELNWTDVPDGINSFTLIVYDPDAPSGNFYHWVVFNIPGDSRNLPEAVTGESLEAMGALQGKNSFGKIGYGGPCPPKGSEHHYNFIVYGLDTTLDLPEGATHQQVIDAMEDFRVRKGKLVGTFQR